MVYIERIDVIELTMLAPIVDKSVSMKFKAKKQKSANEREQNYTANEKRANLQKRAIEWGGGWDRDPWTQILTLIMNPNFDPRRRQRLYRRSPRS